MDYGREAVKENKTVNDDNISDTLCMYYTIITTVGDIINLQFEKPIFRRRMTISSHNNF